MKVKELIAKLQQMDQEALVLCRGYEDGYDPIGNEPSETIVVENVTAEWYNGQYDIALEKPSDFEKNMYDYANPIKAVII